LSYSDAGPPDSCNSTTTPKSESGGHLKKLIKLLTISTVRNVYWYFLIKNKAIDFFHDKNKIILDWDRIVQVELM
jgi:hypothetical protein